LESGAEVKNLGLVDVNIKDLGNYNYVGGLVGYNNGGAVSRCYSTGTVTGNIQVGGLVGINYGSIDLSYSTSTVSGDVDIGGLVGLNFVGSIANSYSTGFVRGDRSVGGLVGSNVEGDVSQWEKTVSAGS